MPKGKVKKKPKPIKCVRCGRDAMYGVVTEQHLFLLTESGELGDLADFDAWEDVRKLCPDCAVKEGWNVNGINEGEEGETENENCKD